MILVDFSSIVHRKIHSSVSAVYDKDYKELYETSKFIDLTVGFIIEELIEIQTEFQGKYGELVLCIDNAGKKYWRKDVYPAYKSNRKKSREESQVNYSEVFEEINKLVEVLKLYSPWKVVDVEKAEADDSMLVLAREFNKSEPILIHSPDKDMIQAQRYNANVQQYSSLTKKWLVPENKHDNMDHWIHEHVCLGDTSDGVPKIVDHTEFSEAFIKHLKSFGVKDEHCKPYTLINCGVEDIKTKAKTFDVWKINRKGEPTDLDVYKDIRFGSSTLEKTINKHGSLDLFLDSHPLYRKHYERNFTLVMEEGIPEYIWDNILEEYKTAKTDYNKEKFEQYLLDNKLNRILILLPNIIKEKTELTADNCGW